MSKKYIFTSESVTEGHPDKICDQVSDAILDACLKQDKHSRVACECFVGKGFMLIGGEITSNAVVNYDEVARGVIRRIGYDDASNGYSPDVAISTMINKQSPDIALGVDIGGAGDQGIMFGYACNDTPELMPAPIQYSHELAKKLTNFRRTDTFGMNHLRPDGKTQVSVVYEDGKVVGIDTIVLSTQHDDEISTDYLRYIVKDKIISQVSFADLITEDTKMFINPTGRFVVGGPMGDTGLTGRKIIVDTYGGYGRHGGGCFSGKDPSKVDRSATYMARYLAKSVVANGLADRCEVQLAYAIGVPEPVAVYVDTFGTANGYSDSAIAEMLKSKYCLTPDGIIDFLGLLDVTYEELAAYGHMGRVDLGVKWESIT